MEHRPPVGWADVATTHEHQLAFRREMAELHAAINGLHGDLRRRGRSVLLYVLALQLTSFALFWAAQQLV